MSAAPASGERARLFLALWPTPRVRAQLAAAQAAWSWPASAALVATEKLHLTLHFIGAVARERVALVSAGLEVEPEPFELRFGRPEVWPGGTAVLRPLAVPEQLVRLHACLGEALRRQALPTEARPFRPHVTLARRAQGATPAAGPPALRWRVRSHVLVESRAGASGGYFTLRRWG